MKKIYMFYFVIFCLCLESCSTMHSIKRNQKCTAKQVDYLYQNNRNAFYLGSTFANFSTVWTYSEDKIVIYRLQKGKIKEKQIFEGKELMQYNEESLRDMKKELERIGAWELDGDLFGLSIEIERKRHDVAYPINIIYLKQGKYNSIFLNKIINDMKKYEMWRVEY